MENQNYKEIKTVEAAFKAEGLDLGSVDAMFAGLPEKFRQSSIKSYKREVVMTAINGVWIPDWSDNNQKKWFPWWRTGKKVGSSGVGLSLHDCNYGVTTAYVGARHVFEDEDKCVHYAEHFKELDEEFYS